MFSSTRTKQFPSEMRPAELKTSRNWLLDYKRLLSDRFCSWRGGGFWSDRRTFGLRPSVGQTTLGSDPEKEERPVPQRSGALLSGDDGPGCGEPPELLPPQRYRLLFGPLAVQRDVSPQLTSLNAEPATVEGSSCQRSEVTQSRCSA